MRYEDALAWLYQRQRFGVKMGLDALRALLERLERPESTFRAFHVTGTNGKGSTCALLEAALRRAGHRVGLYTSPHLVSFRERIRVDGERIAPEDVVRGVQRLRPHVDALDAQRTPPTYFECVTALAFDYFRAQHVPWAVLEVGMGGRLDATNVCQPIVSVVTNVGLDHTERLGTSIQMIAAEKAGILRPRVPALTAARREALDVLAREATRRATPLRVVRVAEPVEETLEGVRFPFPFANQKQTFHTRLLGRHQAENAALALAALEATSREVPVDAEAAQRGLEGVEWPGRLEIVDRDPLTLLDGAHNAPAAEALAGFLTRQFPTTPVAACVGVLRDKAATRILAQLGPSVRRLILTEPPSPRALSAAELEEALPPDAPPAEIHADPSEAFRALYDGGDEPVKIITGSLFLVGEARAQFLGLERDPPLAIPRFQ